MISTDEFIKSIAVKKADTKLNRFKTEILDLRRRGLTYPQIKEFLSLNGVNVTAWAINKFCLKHLNNEIQTKSNEIQSVKPAISKKNASPVFEKKKITELEKNQSEYEIPSYAPKSLTNIDDLI